MQAKKLMQVEIDAPKNQAKLRQGKNVDLSDHYPIITEIDGIKIVSYNLQLIHALLNNAEGKQNAREMKLVAKEFADYFNSINADICCVQELFDSTANKALTAAMEQNGYTTTQLLGSDKLLPALNGGIKFFIKKKLAIHLKTDQHIYQNSIDYFRGDAIVNKGVVHIHFKKDNKTYHIFNTHLQAQYTDCYHYAEVTLAQCVELKEFIEKQRNNAVIKPDDVVMLCGDLNIPKPSAPQDGTFYYHDEDADFLYTKMTHLLGPRFTVLDYVQNPQGPKYTRSAENSNVTDISENLDMAISYDPAANGPSLSDTKLATIYSDIQLNIAAFVKKSATIFSLWAMPPKKMHTLDDLNQKFKQLIIHADKIKEQDNNPLNDDAWIRQANKLLNLSQLASASVDSWQKVFNPENDFIQWPKGSSLATRIFGISPNKNRLWMAFYLLTFRWITIPLKNMILLITEYPLTVISDAITSTIEQLKTGTKWYTKIPVALLIPFSLGIRAGRFLIRMVTSPVSLDREMQRGEGRWNSMLALLYRFYLFVIVPILTALLLILPLVLHLPVSAATTLTVIIINSAMLIGIASEGFKEQLVRTPLQPPILAVPKHANNQDKIGSSYQNIMRNELKPSSDKEQKKHQHSMSEMKQPGNCFTKTRATTLYETDTQPLATQPRI